MPRKSAIPGGQMSNRPLVYLASPYLHKDHDVRISRYESACRAAAILMRQGLMIFSPIAHTHGIAEHGDLPKGWEFWERYDRAMLSCCCRVIVLCLPGWRESTGVQAEIKIAAEMGIPVEYMEP